MAAGQLGGVRVACLGGFGSSIYRWTSQDEYRFARGINKGTALQAEGTA